MNKSVLLNAKIYKSPKVCNIGNYARKLHPNLKILYGMNKSTMITVISPRSTEIAKALMDELERGCTLLKSRGAYRNEEGETLICVLDKKQFYRAKKIVYDIDPRAFMIVSEAQEVYGEGFLDSDWEV